MAEPKLRTVSRSRQVVGILAVLSMFAGLAGCAGAHKGPRTLAAVGATLAVGGSGAWVAGERFDQRTLINGGFVTVVGGIVAMIAAGGWMAMVVSCKADPDCPDEQQCNEIPAPPGGIPYKQCMPR